MEGSRKRRSRKAKLPELREAAIKGVEEFKTRFATLEVDEQKQLEKERLKQQKAQRRRRLQSKKHLTAADFFEEEEGATAETLEEEEEGPTEQELRKHEKVMHDCFGDVDEVIPAQQEEVITKDVVIPYAIASEHITLIEPDENKDFYGDRPLREDIPSRQPPEPRFGFAFGDTVAFQMNTIKPITVTVVNSEQVKGSDGVLYEKHTDLESGQETIIHLPEEITITGFVVGFTIDKVIVYTAEGNKDILPESLTRVQRQETRVIVPVDKIDTKTFLDNPPTQDFRKYCIRYLTEEFASLFSSPQDMNELVQAQRAKARQARMNRREATRKILNMKQRLGKEITEQDQIQQQKDAIEEEQDKIELDRELEIMKKKAVTERMQMPLPPFQTWEDYYVSNLLQWMRERIWKRFMKEVDKQRIRKKAEQEIMPQIDPVLAFDEFDRRNQGMMSVGYIRVVFSVTEAGLAQLSSKDDFDQFFSYILVNSMIPPTFSQHGGLTFINSNDQEISVVIEKTQETFDIFTPQNSYTMFIYPPTVEVKQQIEYNIATSKPPAKPIGADKATTDLYDMIDTIWTTKRVISEIPDAMSVLKRLEAKHDKTRIETFVVVKLRAFIERERINPRGVSLASALSDIIADLVVNHPPNISEHERLLLMQAFYESFGKATPSKEEKEEFAAKYLEELRKRYEQYFEEYVAISKNRKKTWEQYYGENLRAWFEQKMRIKGIPEDQMQNVHPTVDDKKQFESLFLSQLQKMYSEYIGMKEEPRIKSNVDDQVKQFEDEVYSLYGKDKDTFGYLRELLFPDLFIRGVIASKAKYFRSKIASREYSISKLASMNFIYYFPELFVLVNGSMRDVKSPIVDQVFNWIETELTLLCKRITSVYISFTTKANIPTQPAGFAPDIGPYVVDLEQVYPEIPLSDLILCKEGNRIVPKSTVQPPKVPTEQEIAKTMAAGLAHLEAID
jgi:hypothetical protein